MIVSRIARDLQFQLCKLLEICAATVLRCTVVNELAQGAIISDLSWRPDLGSKVGATIRLFVLVFTGLIVGVVAHAAPCSAPRTVRFTPGAASGEMHGSIARGEVACLTIRAHAGQRLDVGVHSIENNVVLQIYRPSWRIGQHDGDVIVSGTSLPGTAEGTDARSWRGVLPIGGTYLLVLGTTRGGGEYRIVIAIH